jgi:hypothetical protein
MARNGGRIMLNPTSNQQMHREDDPTALDICGGVLVLLSFLVSTILAATYLGHACCSLADQVLTLISPAMLRGDGLC